MRDNLDFVGPSRDGLVITNQTRLSVVYLTTEIVGYHHSGDPSGYHSLYYLITEVVGYGITLLPDFRGSHG